MAFDKTVHVLNNENVLEKEIDALLRGHLDLSARDHSFIFIKPKSFLSGSYVFNGRPLGWPEDRDIDVVFQQETLAEQLLTYLFSLADDSAAEYEDLSLYFRASDGRLYNFITLCGEKFYIWRLATGITGYLSSPFATSETLTDLLKNNRSARVDLFVAVEKAFHLSKED